MPRVFLSRSEWPLVAAGIMAGVLTATLTIYFFLVGIGGSGADITTLVSDTAATVVERRQDRDARTRDTTSIGPLVGAREQRVRNRLERMAVSARPLRGPLSITLRDIVWNEADGTRFARAESATGRIDTGAAQRGDVIISDAVLRRAVIAVREERGGWNYEEVFEELLSGGGSGSGPAGRKRVVQVRNLRIDNADVEVTRPAQRFAFRGVQGQLPLIVFSQPGVPEPYLTAARLSGRFVQADPAADLAVELSDGRFSFPDGRVRFVVANAALDDTRFSELDGVWNPADPGYGVTATGRALGVDFADVAFMTPEAFPSTGTATFRFAVRPIAPGGTEATLTELVAETEGSRVLGTLTARLFEERVDLVDADLRLDPLALALVERFTGPLPYGGSLAGTVRGTGGDISFDLVATLTASTVPRPFTTDLTGRVLLTETGFALQRVDVGLQRVPLAALRAIAPALPVDGFVTGRVSLTGMPGDTPLDLDVRLELGAGVALVEGTLDLTGAVARYDLSGRIIGVGLQDVLAPDVPPAALTARFSVAGSGFDPAVMNADIRLAGRFTGWQTTPDDTIDFVGALRGGTLRVETLRASLATMDLTASGDWRFVEPQSGAVTYQLAFSSLAPFGPYLPLVGDSVAAGALASSGSVAGTLDRLRLTGRADARDVRVGGWAAATLDADYDVVLGGEHPEGSVEARATRLVTPTAGAYEEGELTLHMTPPRLAFDVTARRDDGGLVEVVATGTLPEGGPRTVVVERARFDLADDRWTLLSPATIVWTAEGLVDIDNLRLEAEQSEGRLQLSGRILPRGRVDAQFELAAFPLGDIQRLIGRPVLVDGTLWAEGSLRGGTADPLMQVDFRVEDGAVQGVPLRLVEGRLDYVSNVTRVAAQMVVDTVGRLDLELMLPSRLSLDDEFGFELLDGVPLSGSLTANQFALAPFAAAEPRVRDVTGLVDAQVTLEGTADAPRVAGSFTLVDGAATFLDMNQRYTEITGDVGFDGSRLVIRDLRARSDGWAVVGGQVILERLDRPVLDLTVTFDQFRPMGVEDQRDAALYGRVALSGEPDALQLTGNLRVEDGYLVIPEFGATAGVSAELADITRPAPVLGQETSVAVQTDWLRNMRINNLVVAVGDGVWFMTEEARAQLSGELVISKNGDSMPITGTLQGNRGQYTLIAGPLIRRFEIVAASVRFRGLPDPNPLLEITARRVVLDPGGRQLDIDVRISGSLQNPQLSVAGGEAGSIAESELLSFLLFGQPSFALGGQVLPGDALLQQTFAGGFAELAALELERSLGGLGLDIFQIRFGTGPFAGLGAPTFVFGRQLREDVFLTVETGLAMLLGGETSSSPTNTWAIRLDWAFDDRSRLRLALEPVYRGRSLRSGGLALPGELSSPRQQLLVEVRRRWTY
jgi:hypothetical protein